MYYSERLKSPITAAHVKRMFGVDPDSLSARRIGVYPLTEVAGYDAVAYNKVGNTYAAVPNRFSQIDLETLARIKAFDGNAAAIVSGHVADWSSSTTYATNDLVEYLGHIYKARQASTNSVPNAAIANNANP